MPCPVTFRFVARNLPTRARVMAWAPRENHLPFLVSSFPFFPFFSFNFSRLLSYYDPKPRRRFNIHARVYPDFLSTAVFPIATSGKNSSSSSSVEEDYPPRSGKSRVSIYSPPVNPRFILASIDIEGRRGLNCVTVDSKLKGWILISDGGKFCFFFHHENINVRDSRTRFYVLIYLIFRKLLFIGYYKIFND